MEFLTDNQINENKKRRISHSIYILELHIMENNTEDDDIKEDLLIMISELKKELEKLNKSEVKTMNNLKQIQNLKHDINEIQKSIESKETEIQDFKDNYDFEEQFNDYIDDITGNIEILGMSYLASTVLKECDSIAYRCCYTDYVDSIEENELEQIDDYKDLKEELEELQEQLEEKQSDLLELESED